MVNLLVAVLLLVVGLALALGGFLFFRAGLYLLGALLGVSVGLTAMTNPEISTEVGLVLLVAGPLVGLALAVALRLLLVASVGASVGWLATAALFGTPLVPSTPEEIAVVLGGAVVGIVAAYFLETAVIVVVSASWGSLLVALSLGTSASTFVSDPGTLLSTALAVRGVVFVLGVASQAGLWLYLRRNLDDDQDAKSFLLRRAGRLVGAGGSRSTGTASDPAHQGRRDDRSSGGADRQRGGAAQDGRRDGSVSRGQTGNPGTNDPAARGQRDDPAPNDRVDRGGRRDPGPDDSTGQGRRDDPTGQEREDGSGPDGDSHRGG